MLHDIFESLRNIDGEPILEMARIGFVGGYEIWVHTDDAGNIPHFHVWDSSTKGETFHTCVRLDSPKYFHHNGKEDVFNSKQKKELVNFLKSQSKNKRFDSNWEYVLSMWNDNNSNVTIDENSPMPNYLLL